MQTHRWRRGKLVEIPKKWRGQFTTKKTIRERPSKKTRKLRRFSSIRACGRMITVRPERERTVASGSRAGNMRRAIDDSLENT
jgi:hypothetical protein